MILNQWNNFKTLAVVGSLALSAGTALAAEDYATWTYNADVTLNTSSTGAAVTGTVTGFPVLVRLSYRNFLFNEAKGNGADIRFGKAGMPLSYHVERWDSAAEAPSAPRQHADGGSRATRPSGDPSQLIAEPMMPANVARRC